jgi:hypothetical protein
MRIVILAFVACLAGCCGDDTSISTPPDLSSSVTCPAGAEQLNGATCHYGVDHSCRSPHGFDCQCLCTGYWECDQVHVVCDPDAGTPGD